MSSHKPIFKRGDMRIFFILVPIVAGLMAVMAFLSAFGGGTNIQLIAAGIYSLVFVLAIGCEGIMAAYSRSEIGQTRRRSQVRRL